MAYPVPTPPPSLPEKHRRLLLPPSSSSPSRCSRIRTRTRWLQLDAQNAERPTSPAAGPRPARERSLSPPILSPSIAVEQSLSVLQNTGRARSQGEPSLLPYQPTSSYGIPSLPAAIYLEPEFQAARPNLVDVWAGALPEHCHWRTPALPLIVDVIDNALCRPGTAMSTSARGRPASPARPTTVDVIGQPGLQGPAIVDAPRQSGLARPVTRSHGSARVL